MLQVRTNRDHVHIGVGFLDDTAFQTGMHNLSLRLLSVQIQISLLHDFQDRRIDIRLPSAVTIRIFHKLEQTASLRLSDELRTKI